MLFLNTAQGQRSIVKVQAQYNSTGNEFFLAITGSPGGKRLFEAGLGETGLQLSWSYSSVLKTRIMRSLWCHCQMKPGLYLYYTVYTDWLVVFCFGFFSPCPLLTMTAQAGKGKQSRLFFPSFNCRSAVGARRSRQCC